MRTPSGQNRFASRFQTPVGFHFGIIFWRFVNVSNIDVSSVISDWIFDEKEIYPYSTEGIGEDILPNNVDFEVIDHFEKVTDKDAAIYTRKLAKEEGIFAGNSCGAAIKGVIQLKDRLKKDDVVVVILHDSGSRYIGKIYNDDWMKEKKFL